MYAAVRLQKFSNKNNGGIPTPDVIDINGLSDSPTDIQVFFGIDRQVHTSDLLWNIELMRQHIPGSRLLPIACDSAGNMFCFDGSDAFFAIIF